MPLRNVTVTNPGTTTEKQLRRVVITDTSIETHWQVVLPDGTRRDERQEISKAGFLNVNARTTFQNVLDYIRDDTSPRVPT